MDSRNAIHYSTTFGWLSCVICVLLTMWGAVVIPKPNRKSRIVTAFALFALHYALLVVYYDTILFQIKRPASAELIPAFGGYLLIYIGVLLSREAEEEQSGTLANSIAPIDVGAFIFLAILTLAGSISNASTEKWIPGEKFSEY